MAWVRIDDQLHAHPKVRMAWRSPRALGLHLLALSYCGAYLTDGFVAEHFVEDQIPHLGQRRETLGALLASGLWRERDGGGYDINDYLEFNKSKGQVQSERERDAKRKRSGVRDASGQTPSGVQKDSHSPAGGRRSGQGKNSTNGGNGSDARAGKEWEVFAQEHLPDLPEKTVVVAAAQIAFRGETVTPSAVRERVEAILT